MTPEKKANAALRSGIVKLGDRWDRVENLLCPGMPDINGVFESKEFWIESKAPKEPKRATTKLFSGNHPVELDQRNWMLGQLKAGGKVFIYIETANWRFLIDGQHADYVNDMTLLQCMDISLWCSKRPTKKETWLKLRETIIKECT